VTAVTQLTTLSPLPADRVSAVRAAVAALPGGAHSPFASVPGTHFARLVVVTHLGARGGAEQRIELERPCVLFAANCDGDASDYLEGLAKALGDSLDSVFGECDGCPGSADPVAFAAWLQGHEVPPLLAFATVDAPVEAIQAGLEARDRLARFAVRGQSLAPAELRVAWRQEFGW